MFIFFDQIINIKYNNVFFYYIYVIYINVYIWTFLIAFILYSFFF